MPKQPTKEKVLFYETINLIIEAKNEGKTLTTSQAASNARQNLGGEFEPAYQTLIQHKKDFEDAITTETESVLAAAQQAGKSFRQTNHTPNLGEATQLLYDQTIDQITKAENKGQKLSPTNALWLAQDNLGENSKPAYNWLSSQPNFAKEINQDVQDRKNNKTVEPVSPTTVATEKVENIRPQKPSKDEYRARQAQKNAITRSSSTTTITPPPPPADSVKDRIKNWENKKNPTIIR